MQESKLQSIVDRWSNTWNKVAPNKVAQVSSTNNYTDSQFFDQIDKAFQLLKSSSLEPQLRSRSIDSEITVDTSYTQVLIDISSSYLKARNIQHDNEQAALEAKTFAKLIPILKHYRRKNLNAKGIQSLITGFNNFENKKVAENLLDFYTEVLDSGSIAKDDYPSFNTAFKKIFEYSKQTNDEVDLLKSITRKMMSSFAFNKGLDYRQFLEKFRVLTSEYVNSLGDRSLVADKYSVAEPDSKSLCEIIKEASKEDFFYQNKSDLSSTLFDPCFLRTLYGVQNNPADFKSLISLMKNFTGYSKGKINRFYYCADEFFSQKASLPLRELFFKVCGYFQDSSRKWPIELISSVFCDLVQYPVSDLQIQLENYTQALEQGVFQSSQEALANLGDIITSQEVIHRSRGNSGNELTSLELDQVPWAGDDENRVRAAFNQNIEILKLGIERHKSSIADAYLCRKVNDKPPLYQQFLEDWLKPTFYTPLVNQGWRDLEFPGNGWIAGDFVVSEPIKEYVATVTAFPVKTVDELALDDTGKYDRSYDIFGDLIGSTVTRLRGVTIITPDAGEKYNLINSNASQKYSFMFFNEHYANSTNTKALLVPTSLIEENNKLVDFKNNLRPEALRRHADILDLGSMSIFNGGLCNARQPLSKPYFTWEEGANWAPDMKGHKHKYNIRHNYDVLETLQEDHLNIYDLANRFFTMMHQMDVLESLFIKGAKNSDQEDLGFNLENTLETFDAWVEKYQSTPEQKNEFSAVLVDADTFDKASKPNWTIRFDPTRKEYSTRDLESGEIKTYSLPDDYDEREELLLSRVLEAERTLRFYPHYLTT